MKVLMKENWQQIYPFTENDKVFILVLRRPKPRILWPDVFTESSREAAQFLSAASQALMTFLDYEKQERSEVDEG